MCVKYCFCVYVPSWSTELKEEARFPIWSRDSGVSKSTITFKLFYYLYFEVYDSLSCLV